MKLKTYKKRWYASDCGCDPTIDWSLSVESSRSVVTPNGKIGATVANAANGNGCPDAITLLSTVLDDWPPWLFGS